MIYDCAINPYKRGRITASAKGFIRNLPPKMYEEWRIWLATPGFSLRYHAAVFDMSVSAIWDHAHKYEDVKPQVLANWQSATRDDIIKLAHLRPSVCRLPLMVQMQMLEDLKTHTRKQVMDIYHVGKQAVEKLSARKNPKYSQAPLPPEFALIA